MTLPLRETSLILSVAPFVFIFSPHDLFACSTSPACAWACMGTIWAMLRIGARKENRKARTNNARIELIIGGRRANIEAPERRFPEMMSNEFAFEMAVSNVRFGACVTREVGMDLAELRAKRVVVLTDPMLAKLQPVATVFESLTSNQI